jgi:phage terminase large subunit GpA-like protein
MIATLRPRVFTREVLANVQPRPKVRTRDWVVANVFTKDGLPFDADAYPHSLGVYDAFDEDRYREYVMQWAARLGKTFIVQSITEKIAATNPRPMLFASASENVSSDVVQHTLLNMIRHCPALRHELPKRTSKYSVNLRHCRVKVAWSGSHSRLADYSAWFLHANEIDKWTTDKSTEADPLLLATERTKEYPDRKLFFESTPGLRGHSRVEARLLRSTNCRYWVPCPFCGRFQVLRMAQVVWDKRPGEEHSDPDYAYQTARYRCEHCQRELHDEHRPRMMRSGLWVPAGCYAEEGRVCGTPDNPNTPVWGSQLSSLYALSLTWGDCARAFVQSKKRANEFQNFVNSWLGETWEPHRTKSTPEQVAARLKTEVPRGLVPGWVRFLVASADYQGADGGYLVWSVVGFGPDALRAHVVEYGIVDSLADFHRQALNHYWHSEDGRTLWVAIVGVDSGYDTETVYRWCDEAPGRYPLKGSSTALSGKPYQTSEIIQSRSKHRRGVSGQDRQTKIVHVNTDYWETELQERLDSRDPAGPGGLTIPAGAEKDEDFIRELCNGTLSDKLDSRGNARLLWIKRWENEPNDCRDMIRYALCLGRGYLDSRSGQYPQ